MDQQLAIEATGLGRDYGSTCALADLHLEVRAGTIVGLLGPNGAGKTTTMLLLATLLAPSRGGARVFGRDIAGDRAAIRRGLGLMFQETSIDGFLTVEENVLFGARLAGLFGSAAKDAVADALERTGLTDCAHQPSRQLSSGWRRLADLARALVQRPRLLILDEPTVGLDPEHRDRAWSLIETERIERGTTVLFSTHYLAEAEPCDHVVLLARGRSVRAGTPAALKALIGDEVVEIEGPDATIVLSQLQDLVDVRITIRTERGYRVGIAGPREKLPVFSAGALRLQRFAVRPTTLDDVYFAVTQEAR
jgi:ABC-2 type transport system ATP-binding protein